MTRSIRSNFENRFADFKMAERKVENGNQGGVLTVVTYFDIVFIDDFRPALDEISC